VKIVYRVSYRTVCVSYCNVRVSYSIACISYPIVRVSYPIVRVFYSIVYHVKNTVAGTVLLSVDIKMFLEINTGIKMDTL
jgi:hypothetical protein